MSDTKATDAYARKAKIEEKFTAPIQVDPTKAKGLNNRMQTEMFHVGKFVKEDSRDQKYSALAQLTDNQGKTKFGALQANGDELIDYYESKKEKEVYLNELRFAEYLLDPDRPETIKELYSLYPELRETPDEYYQDMVTLQWTLRDILREGRIRSKEEHALIMYVCSAEFDLPVYPAWDPTGFIVGNTDIWKTNLGQAKGYERGFFNAKSFAIKGLNNELVDGKFKNYQFQVKASILRRLYPGLKKATDADLRIITRSQRPGVDGNYKIQEGIQSFSWDRDNRVKSRSFERIKAAALNGVTPTMIKTAVADGRTPATAFESTKETGEMLDAEYEELKRGGFDLNTEAASILYGSRSGFFSNQNEI
jgi:hypothetical protein